MLRIIKLLSLVSPHFIYLDAVLIGVAHCPWDRPVSHFSVDGPPLRMKFHQFDPHIAVIDDAASLRSVSRSMSR